ncbi:beta-ketoacyl-[acyl-carrier-protein] synthase family protein [Longispora albida]|uniref:beta-ketoacyl-[acyl-carrier-protein] synthase family protein n=1 Tax=Longispora albida TaxID=203523 RepID=UPI0003686F8C|nr:beta-ketoacyl-[acyl-carrier-protein] synthase family protein [Longispora albida]
MSVQHRVVLTGFGVLSSIGQGVAEFADGLRLGRSGSGPITAFDTAGFERTNGCEVAGFEAARWIQHVPAEQLGRAAQFSVAAARMAIQDAGLTEDALREPLGLISIGTTDGESADLEFLVEQDVRGGPWAMDRVRAARVSAGRLSLEVAQELGLSRVEVPTIGTACAAGNYAVGYGFDAVRSGEVSYAICGGADAMSRKTFLGFYRLGTISPDVPRPFDVGREGILTGEGAGAMVMETLESALNRGARIYAEVLGYALNCDAHHPVAPDEASIARCIQLALKDANVKPSEVDLISAHGTGTKANDVTEVRAIRSVFGADTPRTVSLKSMLGHTMGAASALATIASALAITHGFIPPTINHRETDPECPIDCVPNIAVPADLRIVQNNGLAFGGNNAILVLGRYEGKPR